MKRLPAIKSIYIDGQHDLRRLAPWDYECTRDEFADPKLNKFPVVLPTWQQLNKIGDRDELWALLRDILVEINFKNGWKFVFVFLRGFIYDQTSTPVGRNNLLEAIIATLIHDFTFSLHLLWFLEQHGDEGFRAGNKLMYRVLRCDKIECAGDFEQYDVEKMSLFSSIKYYLAVNGIFGRAAWEHAEDRAFWHGQTAGFSVYDKNNKLWLRRGATRETFDQRKGVLV
jgi:hypothetical protein